MHEDRRQAARRALFMTHHCGSLRAGRVVSVANHRYADNNWADDSLLACLREFTDFPLFSPPDEVEHHEFLEAPHVIDVHQLPEGLRKLAVFLMLDRLYADIMAMPDAPLDASGNRQMRLIIVIDEAHP